MTMPPPPEQQTNVLGEPGPPPGEPRASNRLGWGLLLGALVLIALAAAAAAAWFATRSSSPSATTTTAATTTAPRTTTSLLPPGKVFVPGVTGMQEVQAAARLGAAGLKPKVRLVASTKPPGTVISQSPQGGAQVRKGAVVTIVLAHGAPAVAVPDLRGLTLASAAKELAAAGLKVQTTPVTAPNRPPGTVVSQAPPAGKKLTRGAVVLLSVARKPPAVTSTASTTTAATSGKTTSTARTTTTAATTTRTQPATVTVPNLVGQTLAQAAAQLGASGIFPNVAYIPSTQPLGTVVEQAKPAGTTVQRGSYVRVNVAEGPNPPASASVPNVGGKPRAQAMSALSAAGFQVKVLFRQVATSQRNDTVLDEQPGAGTSIPNGALVILIVGKQSGA